ncbi:MAG: hypothetical protein U0R78_16815 [Nocardioidaceae bacterium]
MTADVVPKQPPAPVPAPPDAQRGARHDVATQVVRILEASRDEAAKVNRTHALPGILLVAGLAIAFCGPVLAAVRVPQVDWFTPSVGIAGYACGTVLALASGVLGLLSHVLPVKWDDQTRQGAVSAAIAVEQERVKAEVRQRESDEALRRLREGEQSGTGAQA